MMIRLILASASVVHLMDWIGRPITTQLHFVQLGERTPHCPFEFMYGNVNPQYPHSHPSSAVAPTSIHRPLAAMVQSTATTMRFSGTKS